MSGAPGASEHGPWWRGAFGAAYLTAYAHRDDGSARDEAEFAARLLGVVAGTRVLDAGCGAGRHAAALGARGAAVVGIDWSPELLEAAARRSAPSVRWVRGDVRALPFRSAAFACVTSFFTSFGYFDDAGDRAHAGELRRVLPRGGRLLLDFLNAPRVAATLVPASSRDLGADHIDERRWISAGRVGKSVTVVRDGAVAARWEESVRLYERDELEAVLGAAGFAVRGAFGDLGGAPWNPEAPRLVLHAEAA